MMLSPSFDTSIDQLLALQNDETLFVSTWDKGAWHLDIPDTFIWPAIRKFPELKNEYFFSDEMSLYKRDILQSSSFSAIDVKAENLGIFSNGTSAAMLSIMSVKEIVSSIRALLIAPTYFGYIKVLRELNSEIFYHPVAVDVEGISLPFDKIAEEILSHKVNLVILPIPLFGMGLSPDRASIEALCKFCASINCYMLIDYVYGGMEWHTPFSLANEWLWNLCVHCENTILIESLSKRVFLNGIKAAIVGASQTIIQHMELKSVYLTGALTYSQVTVLQLMYSNEHRLFVERRIKENIDYFQSNYELLKAICQNTPILVLPCSEGYFCLAEFDKRSTETSMEVSTKILKKANVLTIPHDRYLYFTPQKYVFRINLSTQTNDLFFGISRLLQLYF